MDNYSGELFLKEMQPLPTGLEARGYAGEDIRCILFDIYGTLFISSSGDIGSILKKSDRQESLQSLLNRYGIDLAVAPLLELYVESITLEHERARGVGIDYPEVDILEIWNRVIAEGTFGTRDELQQFAEEFELTINPVFPMPGLKECLDDCRKKKLVMGIISNAQFYTPLLFNRFLNASLQELGFNMDLVFFSYRQGIAKPSITLFEGAAEQVAALGLDNHNVLYVGNDMLNDILPASKIGFKTALFAGDKRSLRLRRENPECRSLKPDLILTCLTQLFRTQNS